MAWFGDKGVIPEGVHICLVAAGPDSEAVSLGVIGAGWITSVINPARITVFSQGEPANAETKPRTCPHDLNGTSAATT